MKTILLTATAAAALAATTFGAGAQTTITTTTRTVEPQVVFTPDQTTVIRRTIVNAPADPIVLDDDLIVGATVPDTVTLQPVPATLVTEVPSAQNYQYAVVENEVVFVDPATRRVVAVVNQ